MGKTMSEFAGADEGALYRKITWRLVPFLLACYTVAIIDRFNISFAKLQFLHDLHMNNEMFGFAAGVFSIGYVALEVPSNLLLDRIGVGRTLLRIMVLWGVVTMLMMFVRNQYHLYLLRFLLGAAEGGLFPGVLFYLTLWFPDRLRGRMTSLFVMAVPFGGIIAGPVSGLVMDRMRGMAGLYGWQWLFLVEGLPAVALGIAAFFYLPDRPSQARWLTVAEVERVAADIRPDRPPTGGGTSFAAALRDGRVYLLSCVYFSFFCSLNTILLWAPTLLRNVGVATATNIGWLSGGLSLASALGMLAVGYSSDRRGERHWHVALCGFVSAGCFLLLPLASSSIIGTIACLTAASIGIFSILSLFWTIPSAYLHGSAAAGGIALISAVGSFGGAVCPAVGWLTVKTGSLYGAFAAIGLLHAAGMIALLLFAPGDALSAADRSV
ncbi:MFS transporter [Acidiphilium sp.]|uniref:MFS transporter n=1 Tax=Acidiphilium sp. TaxID=527 RepID=UPI002587482A|nr:MFS transporter [Acidiphilium sp.]